MIYFSEITDASGKAAEKILFQFYPRELPESIPIGFKTKVNHIEYNGGFTTNQIIGIYEEPIEWEGCFYGTYAIDETKNETAKDRAFKLKNLLGKPLRCVFAVPTSSTSKSNPGFDSKTHDGKEDSGLRNGYAHVYIIEQLDLKVSNYTDVDYKIRLIPHQRQEKIKPKDVEIAAIKIDFESAQSASTRINKKPINKEAAKASAGSSNTSEKAKPGIQQRFREGLKNIGLSTPKTQGTPGN